MADLDLDAASAQAFQRPRGLDVAACGVMAHAGEHGCDRAHACSAHPDHMDAKRLAEIDLRCRRGAHARTFDTDSTSAATRSAASR